MEDEDADLLAAKLASIQEAQAAGIPILEDLDADLANLEEQEQLEMMESMDGAIPAPPPAPTNAKKKSAAKSSTTPKVVVPVWKNFVYVEFSFAAPDVKEGITVAIDYNNYAEGAPMQRIGDKYFQTIALGCGKTFKYKVRFSWLGSLLLRFYTTSSTHFGYLAKRQSLADAHSRPFPLFLADSQNGSSTALRCGASYSSVPHHALSSAWQCRFLN